MLWWLFAGGGRGPQPNPIFNSEADGLEKKKRGPVHSSVL